MDSVQKLPSYFIVAGASAGGTWQMAALTKGIARNTDAAFFFVTHITEPEVAKGFAQRIQKETALKCKLAEDEETIQPGCIYIAVPGKHLLIDDGKIKLGKGPIENRWRPSIDALFRSAAVHHSSRVIGIILSGFLNDGTAGMLAVKQCGGTCMVQDPAEAEIPAMITSVQEFLTVDHILPVSQVPAVLTELISKAPRAPIPVPAYLRAEAAIAENAIVDMDILKQLGEHSVFTCPECGGGLWEIKDGFTRYRCHTGHVFSEPVLAQEQQHSLETTLWVALRMMEEKKQMLGKMANEDQHKGRSQSSKHKVERLAELDFHIGKLKEILFDMNDREEPVVT